MLQKATPVYSWLEYKLVQPLWKSVWRIFKEVKVNLREDIAMTLLGIFLKYYIAYYRDSTFS